MNKTNKKRHTDSCKVLELRQEVELMEADKEKERKLAERESEIRELKVNLEEVNCCLKATRAEASETKKLMERQRSEADRLISMLKEAVERLDAKIDECNGIDGKFNIINNN